MSKLRGLTTYQQEILTAVHECAAKGFDIDLDQLLECLSWKPTKQSLQFSIRALVAKKMIVKTGFQVRRGRKRVCFALTDAGRAVFDPRGAPAPEKAPHKTPEKAGYLPGEDVVPGLSADLLSGLGLDNFDPSDGSAN